MLRLSTLVKQHTPGFANAAAEAVTDGFVQRAAYLKRRFRGKGQYAFARAEAQRFLDAEVPKTELSNWIETDNHAVALAQVMGFFEVEVQDTSLASLLLNKLVRTAEAGGPTTSAQTRLEAILSLMAMRPEENYERACDTVNDVLRHLEATPASSTQRWRVLDHCAKVLQRCGRRVTTDTNTRLAQAVASQIQRTPLAELSSEQNSLLRIYAWMSRADIPEADAVLKILRANVDRMQAFEFATMMASVWRHHQFQPLPVETMQALARDGLQYCHMASGRDIGIILGTVARLLASAQQPHTATVSEKAVPAPAPQAVGHLADRFTALLEDYQPRVLDLMDPASSLYWKKSEDIVAIAYAYELGGRARHRAVFLAFQRYVQKEVAALEPAQLALTIGILHRSLLLSADLLAPLSDRVETVMGELRLPELSHVCAALASTRPSWMREAEAVAQRLIQQAEGPVSAATYLQLTLAFPHVPAFAHGVDSSQLSVRQLMDSLLSVLQTPFEGPLTTALVGRLAASPAERFTPDDIHLLRTCQRSALVEAAGAYLHQRFGEPQWTTDTLFCAPLAGPNEPLARDVQKAMQAAASASVSPELFVSLAELLLGLFGAGDAEVTRFILKGGNDLLSGRGVLVRTMARYLSVVRRYPGVYPSTEWLQALTHKIITLHRPVLRDDELENLLISLHAIYRNCQQTAALQVLLSELAEVYYDGSCGDKKVLRCPCMVKPAGDAAVVPGVNAARVTVLLAHLQQGMSLPLLTAATPAVCAVRQQADKYPPDVRQAVLSMPLKAPMDTTSATGQSLGRFTLKRHVAPSAHHESLDEVQDFTEAEARAAPGVTAQGAAPHGERRRQEIGDTLLEGDPFEMDATAAPPPVQPAPTAVASAASHTVESTEPTRAEPARREEAPITMDNTPEPHTESHASPSDSTPSQDAGSSYYAKFFHKTVGQILSGHRRADAERGEAGDAPTHAAPTSASRAPPGRPHRTALRPLAASTSSAPQEIDATPQEVGSTPFAVPDTAPTPAPVPATPSAPAAQSPQPAQPVESESNSGASVFEKLFGGLTKEPEQPVAVPDAPSQSHSAPQPFASPSTVVEEGETPQNRAAVAFAQLFSADAQSPPTPPSAAPPVVAPAPTPAAAPSPFTMRAQPRAGGHFFVDPANPSPQGPGGRANSLPPMRPRPVMSRRPPVVAGADPAAATGTADVSLDAATGQGGVVTFMNQAGLSKVTGYNMATPPAAPVSNSIPNNAAAAAVDVSYRQQQNSAHGGRLAWQETARQLARVTRRPHKAKAGRGRTQTSLSEWLSTPDATLQDAEAAAAAVASTDITAPAAAAKRGRKGKATAASTASASAVAAADTHGAATSKGRGRKGKASSASAAKKPSPTAVKKPRGGGSTAASKKGRAATKSAKAAKPATAGKSGAKTAARTATKKTPAAAAPKKKKATPAAAKKPAAARKTVKKAAAAAANSKAKANAKPKPKAKAKAKAKGKKK